MTASLADTAAGHCAGSNDSGFPDATSVPAMAAFIWGLSTPGVRLEVFQVYEFGVKNIPGYSSTFMCWYIGGPLENT